MVHWAFAAIFDEYLTLWLGMSVNGLMSLCFALTIPRKGDVSDGNYSDNYSYRECGKRRWVTSLDLCGILSIWNPQQIIF